MWISQLRFLRSALPIFCLFIFELLSIQFFIIVTILSIIGIYSEIALIILIIKFLDIFIFNLNCPLKSSIVAQYDDRAEWSSALIMYVAALARGLYCEEAHACSRLGVVGGLLGGGERTDRWWPAAGMNLSCEPDLPLPDYFSHRYRVIGTFFQGIIFLVGVLGNATVVCVVSRVRSLRTPTNCYLVSLAVADSVVLLASVPNEIFSYYLVGNRWLWGEVGCRLIIFSQNLGINASSLSLVAFTVERYIAICHPMKAHKMCTLGRAKRITLAVWAFACVYCSPWIFGLTTTRPLKYQGFPDFMECAFQRPRNEYLFVFFTDLVMFYVIPLILSCILYYFISRSLSTELQLQESATLSLKKRIGSKAQVIS